MLSYSEGALIVAGAMRLSCGVREDAFCRVGLIGNEDQVINCKEWEGQGTSVSNSIAWAAYFSGAMR